MFESCQVYFALGCTFNLAKIQAFIYQFILIADLKKKLFTSFHELACQYILCVIERTCIEETMAISKICLPYL